MPRAIRSVAIALTICACGSGAPKAPAAPPYELSVQLTTAVNDRSEPTAPADRIPEDTREIFLSWQVTRVAEPLTLRAVWVAENTGGAAPANYAAGDATTRVERDEKGFFNFSRPSARWPKGSYRVDVYVNDKVVRAVKFTIE